MGDPQHPEQAEAWVKKLQADGVPKEPGRSKYVAFGFFILDLLFGNGAKLVSLLEAPQSAANPFTIAAESAGAKSVVREWLKSGNLSPRTGD